MVGEQAVLFVDIVGLHRYIGSLHLFQAGRRTERVDQGLRFLPCWKPAEAMFRHT